MAPTSSQNSSLSIIRGKKQGNSFAFNKNDSSSVIQICFNPTTYTLSKTNSFTEAKIPGLGSPIIQFNQGDTQTLDLELMLDSSISDQSTKDDVREKYIVPLEKLIQLDSELHAPPPCKIIWGSLNFVGVLKTIKKNYILFAANGNPTRAKVTLNFSEYIPMDLQTKGAPLNSPDRRKLFKVNQGDSIWQMAYNAYGDAKLWRVIAQANQIANPLNLAIGTDLIIPVLPEQKND